MIELEIGGVKYRTGKLDVFEQAKVVKRVAGFIPSIGKAIAVLPRSWLRDKPEGDDSPEEEIDNETASKALDPIIDALNALSDADLEFLMKVCLSKAQRWNGANWGPVMTGGVFAFEDEMDLSRSAQIILGTVWDNLSSFFTVRPRQNTIAGSSSEAKK